MKKILVPAIILLFFASFADANLPVMEKCRVNLTELMAAAKASLSEDGVGKLQQIFANAKVSDKDEATVGSIFFLVPALLPDLGRNELARVKKFLKLISDKRLVSSYVSGGGREFKGRGLFRIVYSLEARPLTKADEKAGVPTGRRYGLKAQKHRPGETRISGTNEYQIRLDK
jgi:hypothetical protein